MVTRVGEKKLHQKDKEINRPTDGKKDNQKGRLGLVSLEKGWGRMA